MMFIPEHVDMNEAKELLKKPRQGNVIYPFKRQKYMPEVRTEEPVQKRSRSEESPLTGNIIFRKVN